MEVDRRAARPGGAAGAPAGRRRGAWPAIRGGASPAMHRAAALVAIVALGLGVRLAGIGDRLSDAEGWSWIVASAPSAGALLDRLAAYENTPPLFYALLAPLPHGDEAWLRAPALLPALAAIPVVYALVRPLLGTRVAVLAALALAVAPFHVSYSNYSRGFMLAGLGLLLAAWAVARLAEGGPKSRGAVAAGIRPRFHARSEAASVRSRWLFAAGIRPRTNARFGERRSGRWWWLWLGGATLALHSEYDSALLLAPLAALPALWRARGWRTVAPLALLPALTLLPLTGEVLAGLDQIDVTKLTPPSPEPSWPVARDAIVSLMLGTHGLAGSSAVRALQLLAILGGLTAAALLLWRTRPAAHAPSGTAFAATSRSATADAERPAVDPAARREIAVWILVIAPGASIALHALAAVVGPNLLDARYLATLIPFLVALLAAGVVALPWRWPAPATVAVLLALGAAVFIQRFDRELQPDVAPAGEIVRAAGARTVLTNSPVIAYYLRDLDARVDRPFGLANAEPECATECPAPIAIVEDARLPGGVRPGPGAVTVLDPLVVRVRP